ncbi:Ras association domain-containing protein 7, partial [Cariama cristata]
MELKVWVDGIQRVVCGVSEQTTCQEVVIALARAIGQTGRYVLVQLPLECPLESLAKCGQYANDVQFVLRRTGPSMAERPSSEGVPQAPERTFIRASLPIKPRPASTDAPRSREPLEEYTQRIYELSVRTEALQEEIQWEMAERAKRGKETPVPSPTELEDMAAKMKRDLEAKVKQGNQLESNLASVEKALEEAERNLQAQTQELEELNKELRQCNLQQFIQQTGATVTVLQARSEEDAQPE